jgi:hypothetical protein
MMGGSPSYDLLVICFGVLESGRPFDSVAHASALKQASFGSIERPSFRPDQAWTERRAQATSRMAAGHRAAARSVLDAAKHDATIGATDPNFRLPSDTVSTLAGEEAGIYVELIWLGVRGLIALHAENDVRLYPLIETNPGVVVATPHGRSTNLV